MPRRAGARESFDSSTTLIDLTDFQRKSKDPHADTNAQLIEDWAKSANLDPTAGADVMASAYWKNQRTKTADANKAASAAKDKVASDESDQQYADIYKGINDATNEYKTDSEAAINKQALATSSNLGRQANEMASLSGGSGYGGAAAAGQAQAALGANQQANTAHLEMYKNIAAQRKAMLDMQWEQAKNEGNQALMLKLDAARNRTDVLSAMVQSPDGIQNPDEIFAQMGV